jgi:uncharacterized protein YndB with AHSA1/START domain
MEGTASNRPDYGSSIHYRAPREPVFDAAATPSGPGGWWTTRGENVTRG